MSRIRVKSTVRKNKRRYKRRYTRSNRTAYKALRIARSLTKRVAGEVCKYESTPSAFRHYVITSGDNGFSIVPQQPLLQIQSGTPYIYPINWQYSSSTTSFTTSPIYIDGQSYTAPDASVPTNASVKLPIWYNTLVPSSTSQDYNDDSSTQLQYRLKYIYINALFNASISQSTNNNDGAVRIVIVCDKQPTAGSATWYTNDNSVNTLSSRGVFNSNRIDAQLNAKSVGRFKIMYDKTLRFNTINGYKPFKYFKRLSSVVRNNTPNPQTPNSFVEINNTVNSYQKNESPAPVLKNAYYMMIFSDGIDFTYSNASSSPSSSFHLFCRVAYYNN